MSADLTSGSLLAAAKAIRREADAKGKRLAIKPNQYEWNENLYWALNKYILEDSTAV